jgi:hypothetical protein
MWILFPSLLKMERFIYLTFTLVEVNILAWIFAIKIESVTLSTKYMIKFGKMIFPSSNINTLSQLKPEMNVL